MNDIHLTINIFALVDDIINIMQKLSFLKTKLGIDKIRVRKKTSFLSRLYAILCCYNLILELDLAI